MTLTTAKITQATGLAAVVAGLLFIIIQPIHPAEEVATVTQSAWAIVGSMTLGFAILGLVGVTGIYLRQVKEAGVLGLVGYVLLGLFFLLATAFVFAETLILPPLASEAPQFVDSSLGIFSGSPGEVDLGALGAMGAVSFGLYLLGGALLGIALFRARVLSRGGAVTLAFAAVATLVVPLLPHAVGRYAAVPVRSGAGLARMVVVVRTARGHPDALRDPRDRPVRPRQSRVILAPQAIMDTRSPAHRKRKRWSSCPRTSQGGPWPQGRHHTLRSHDSATTQVHDRFATTGYPPLPSPACALGLVLPDAAVGPDDVC